MQDTADQILRKNGKSFHFAGKFLDKDQKKAAARLYQFCRSVDDIADDKALPWSGAERKSILDEVFAQIDNEVAEDKLAALFLDLEHECGLDKRFALNLIEGVKSDITSGPFKNEADLIGYCYRVAGTVGGLMAPIIGVRNPAALGHAIDMGIAMQLTNIARDIFEDADNGRCYIPESWGLAVNAGMIARREERAVRQSERAARKFLNRAERFYVSGINGLRYIPGRARFAIAVAALVYRQIGLRVKMQDYKVWQGRIYVPGHEKLTLVPAALKVQWRRRTLNHHRFIQYTRYMDAISV